VAEIAVWIRENLSGVEALFADENIADSCNKLSTLRKAMTDNSL
jgi:hypothetical protein